MIIKLLAASERETVRKFYLSLSPEDRRRRFCCTLSDRIISKYVDRMNFTRDTILGAFDEQARLVGLGELVRGAEANELAFSVRADKRGQKIGTKLMQRLLLRARICGIGKVSVLFVPDNTPMRRMTRRAGMVLSAGEGEACAALELSAPSAQELAQWFVEESLAYGGYFGNLGVACWGALVSLSASATPWPLETPAPAA